MGYLNQAFQRSQEVLKLVNEVSHPHSFAFALTFVVWLHEIRREGRETQERTEVVIRLSTEYGFPDWLAWAKTQRGWALAEQGQTENGIAQMREGLSASRATGAELLRPYFLTLLAATYGEAGQPAEGLRILEEALVLVRRIDIRHYEAELYRLKGELTLQQSKASLEQVSDKFKTSQDKSEDTNPQPLTPSTQAKAEAEACFLKAIDISRKQQAKSLELRATMSLARLWQQQGKRSEAHDLLSKIYNWFTEGFDTKDLQEAKVLLEELSR